MAKFFVSHTIYDRAFVDRLERILESRGHSVFVDRGEVAAGSSWAETIRDAIENADAFIVLVSQPSLSCDYAVAAEVGAAWGRGKRIVAIETPDVSAAASLPLPRADYRVVAADGLSDDEIATAILNTVTEQTTSLAS